MPGRSTTSWPAVNRVRRRVGPTRTTTAAHPPWPGSLPRRLRAPRARSEAPPASTERSGQGLRIEAGVPDAGFFMGAAMHLELKKERLDLTRLRVMGVLNRTPDSFSD